MAQPIGSVHEVAILALPGVIAFDLSIACEVFGRLKTEDGRAPYRVRVCGEASTIGSAAFGIIIDHALDELAAAHTIIVPGVDDPAAPVSEAVLRALRQASGRGARVASICSGAFVLAAAGLLDGRRATTHWLAAADFAARFPRVTLDADVLFVDEGRVVTSAGAMAGMDMCLHLVRRDHGQALAATAARLAVAPLNRDGGQSQFIRYDPPQSPTSLASLLDWMQANLDEAASVARLAARAGMSSRTFARRFQEQTGTTPHQWLILARVRRAQHLLEASSAPIDEVAQLSGFESAVTFRTRFRKIVGLCPSTYRRRFEARSAELKASGDCASDARGPGLRSGPRDAQPAVGVG